MRATAGAGTAPAARTAVVVARHGGPEVLALEQTPVPTPGPGQVLLDVEAAGVAYADVLMRRGVYPETPALPFTPGYDVVGRVVATGPAAEHLRIGSRVAALTVTGGCATRAVADAALTVPVPEHLAADAVVALVLNYVTAYQVLHRVARVPVGGAVLVHGAAGGVGTALLELAAVHGVTAFGSASGARTQAVRERGAVAVDRTTEDVAAVVRRHVPGGVDATFDAVGGPHLQVSRRATARTGTVVSYGISFAVDDSRGRRSALVRQGLALARMTVAPGPRPRIYVIAGRRGAVTRRPDSFRADLQSLLHLLEDGRVRPATTCMPLTDVADAHAALEAGRVTGKLVLLPEGVA